MTQAEKEEYINGNGGYTQQELEAYARQKQLELLDEIKEELQHISTYLDTQDEDGFYFETIDLDDALNILTKKREQITLENKHEK